MDLVPHSRDPQHEFEIRGDKRPFEDLRTSGLLWMINRLAFHTRGYALAISFDGDGDGDATGWQILGDGTRPWAFTDETDSFDQAEDTLREAAERSQAEAAMCAAADWPDL
jgi:hypothetical protein